MSDAVLTAIRASVREVLPEIDPALVTEDVSLSDLGANSIDRVDVVTMTMDALGISLSVTDLLAVHDIGTLAGVLRRHLP
ncbi:phosphopantetheine-binding protein [Kitasatospora sp. NPDC056327]|uniref:phosphopantetheine-binding protein n=1 Tax=Kitasatospora sp. NPDC056327 TaxID=3345785 RepID=UPI0035E1DE15